MAHQIWEVDFEESCPRCESNKVRLATYHFGNTFIAECAGCGFGQIAGDNQITATSRLKGQYLERRQRGKQQMDEGTEQGADTPNPGVRAY